MKKDSHGISNCCSDKDDATAATTKEDDERTMERKMGKKCDEQVKEGRRMQRNFT